MFRLNRLTDYAVVVMSHMASRGNDICKAPKIAEDTGVPLPTVAKVLSLLQKAELVRSHRGMSGGYSLCRTADEITVKDIIQALDGPIALTACVDGAPDHCDVESLCPMRGNWNKVNHAIRDALSQVSLADMTFAPEFLGIAKEDKIGQNSSL